MSEEQFKHLGAMIEDLGTQISVVAEANMMTREYLAREIQSLRTETTQRADGIEANLGRFAVRVGERFDKLEGRFDAFASETQQRLGNLEAQGEVTQQRLGKLEAQGEVTQQRLGKLETQGEETQKRLRAIETLGADTQQRVKRIEALLPVKSSPSSRTPPRATRTPLTKRHKKS
jgi:chromosome segregation ATPase